MIIDIDNMPIDELRQYKERIDDRISAYDVLMSHAEPFDMDRIKGGAKAILIQSDNKTKELRYLAELNGGETVIFVLEHNDHEQTITVKKDGTAWNGYGEDKVYIYNPE